MNDNITTIKVGSLETCCYIVSNNNKECIVIDPGEDAVKISEEIAKRNLICKYIMITHSHFDHVAGLSDLKSMYGDAKILCHKICGKRMQTPQFNLGEMLGIIVKTPPEDKALEENEIIDFGNLSIKCLYLPGHAPGHMVFYISELKSVFCGDTLFNGSMGRTDFEGCSYNDLAMGIKNHLLTLPKDTVVYPGHGLSTTIKKELNTNPFIKDIKQ